MVYDEGRHTTVLYGGTGQSAVYDDTWEWDGSTWTERKVPGPGARMSHAMTYDATRGRTVLFGGTRYPGGVAGDTWEWDGSTWTERSVAGPPARFSHAMSFDRARNRVVLFGGSSDAFAPALSDTWEWDGTAWTERTSVHKPLGRYEHGMAYHSLRGHSVMFGGYLSPAGGSGTATGDTWEWDGTDWLATSKSGPEGRGVFGMTYDPDRGAAVLFGGFGYNPAGDTWQYR
jgi:hypothetical protein